MPGGVHLAVRERPMDGGARASSDILLSAAEPRTSLALSYFRMGPE